MKIAKALAGRFLVSIESFSLKVIAIKQMTMIIVMLINIYDFVHQHPIANVAE